MGSRDGDADFMALTASYARECAHDCSARCSRESNAQYVLARSFRSRSFIAPDLTMIDARDETLLIATEGFWVDIDPAAQNAFVGERFLSNSDERDDRGVLSISGPTAASLTSVGASPGWMHLSAMNARG